MVSICIFAKELIYAFESLWPPNHSNHTAPVTRACAFKRLWISSFSFPLLKLSKIHKSTRVNAVTGLRLIACVQIIVTHSLSFSLLSWRSNMCTIFKFCTLPIGKKSANHKWMNTSKRCYWNKSSVQTFNERPFCPEMHKKKTPPSLTVMFPPCVFMSSLYCIVTPLTAPQKTSSSKSPSLTQ